MTRAQTPEPERHGFARHRAARHTPVWHVWVCAAGVSTAAGQGASGPHGDRDDRRAALLSRLEATLGGRREPVRSTGVGGTPVLEAPGLGIVQRCPTSGRDGPGAPRLTAPGVRAQTLPPISFAHVGGSRPGTVLAWLDVHAEDWAVGVDVEDVRARRVRRAFTPGPDGAADIDAVAFSAAERAGLERGAAAGQDPVTARARLWCAKEALVKAAGTGFLADPSAVDAAASDVRLVALGPDVLPDGWVGALALRPLTPPGRSRRPRFRRPR